MLLASPLCRTARRLNKLLWKKLLGKRSKQFPSGKSIAAWHSGHRNFPSLWLTLACFSKHSQQNVWKHDIILGSLKVSRQMEQVTCCLMFFKRDSIAIDKHEKTLSNQINNWRLEGIDFDFRENRTKSVTSNCSWPIKIEKLVCNLRLFICYVNLIFIVVWELYF